MAAPTPNLYWNSYSVLQNSFSEFLEVDNRIVDKNISLFEKVKRKVVLCKGNPAFTTRRTFQSTSASIYAIVSISCSWDCYCNEPIKLFFLHLCKFFSSSYSGDFTFSIVTRPFTLNCSFLSFSIIVLSTKFFS
jgi:hypothetical protein